MPEGKQIIRKETVTLKQKITMADRARLGENSSIDMIRNKKKIGSAYAHGSTAPLSGLTFEEEKKYLPSIIGVSPTHADFREKVNEYWKNISKDVDPETGVKLQVGMIYPDEEAAKKADNEAATELARIIKARNEGQRYDESFNVRTSVGEPINVSDYVLYRYCLKYSKVANNPDDLYKSPKIEFFLHSEVAERNVRQAQLRKRNKATAAYLELINDRSKSQDVLTLFKEHIQRYNELPTSTTKISTDSEVDSDLALEIIAREYPEEFISLTKDKHLTLKAFIERAITANELRRLPNTNTIVYGDNQVIGNSMNDAVAFLTNDTNKEILNTLKARLNAFKK